MADEDRAQDIELIEWERNNTARPGPAKFSPGDIGYGPDDCQHCGADMPTARREHGFTLCVPCKSRQERPRGR